MNGVVILVFLLLIIPAQLYFNYIVSSIDEAADKSEKKTRSLSDILKQLEDSIAYYSTLDHFKEFFIVPHQRRPRNSLKKKFQQMLNHNLDMSGSGGGNNEKGNIKDKKLVNTNTKGGHFGIHGNREHTDMSEAKEVEKYNHDSVYFARSPNPRKNRPTDMKFRIGDVVKHKQDGYYGVVIGWDLKCLAPDWWLRKHGYYTDKSKQGFLNRTHYLVLVESDDDSELLYYIPEQHLQLHNKVMVKSSHVDKYFEHYSGRNGNYIAKEWLKKRYPDD